MEKIIKRTLFILSVFVSLNVFSVDPPFGIIIEPVSIAGLNGVQSYAFGQGSGKWLIVGGRLDGLHKRQPNSSFDVAGNNNQLIVIDPVSEQKWSASLSSLPIAIQEQLSSTNMEFYQEGNYLYCLGGYGYSATEGDHTTFTYLTAINVSDVIDAVVNGTAFDTYFRQISDANFQVTGGRLRKIEDKYYLLGGQKFIGRYNPMGPNNGPGFIQEYTNSIRIFSINDDGININITHFPSHVDAVNLHRRDYNAEPQIMPNGAEGITMFSGVFQKDVNLPFLNSINVSATGYEVNNVFTQYYNHYHCPVLPLYSAVNNEMHTVFFGGIAQYYDSLGVLVQDDNVPFVNTIARVTRDGNGVMTEYKLPVGMPSLLGSGAEFITNNNLPKYANEVIKLDSLSLDIATYTKVLVGYIYGGISSDAANIFEVNDGTQSSASSQVFKVYLSNQSILSVDKINESSVSTLKMSVYPNPSDGLLNIKYNLNKVDDISITISEITGAKVETILLRSQSAGKHTYIKRFSSLSKEKMYFITLESSTEKHTQKLILKR